MKMHRLASCAATALLAFTITTNILAQSTWQLRHPLPTQHGLLGIAYATNRFVAVGGRGSIVTSTDGTNWTRAAGPESNIVLHDVSYGGS